MTDVAQQVPAVPIAGQCAICLEREASVIAPACGHLVCCVSCRRRLVHQARADAGVCGSDAHFRRNLSTKQLERTKVSCPICRGESVLVHQDRFDGHVFVSTPCVKVSDDEGDGDGDGDGDALTSSEDSGYLLEARRGNQIVLRDVSSLAGACLSSRSSSSDPHSALWDGGHDDFAFVPEEEQIQIIKPDPHEAKRQQIESKLLKLYRYAMTSLMNDRDMDAFLGGLVYRVMQSSSFKQALHQGGKTNSKAIEKRRKLKLRLSPGLRLDGKPSDGGAVVIEVRKLEEKEAAFGELVRGMLAEVRTLSQSARELCNEYADGSNMQEQTSNTIAIAGRVLALLTKYEARHTRRQTDLNYLIEHGDSRPEMEDDIDLVDSRYCIRMRQSVGTTTFMIDGAQLSQGFIPSLHCTQKGRRFLPNVAGVERLAALPAECCD